MKKYTNYIIVILTIITLIMVLINKNLVSEAILSSLYIWYNTLIPSMFPMIILSDILITYSSISIIPRPITNIMTKLFNISYNAVTILLVSLVSGFPTNAICIKKAIDTNKISKEEATHLLLFCNFANPLFILETIGSFYLNDVCSSIIILISHILGNIIIGIIFRYHNHPTFNYKLAPLKSQSFEKVLSSSITKSVNSLLLIGGTVTLFLILTTLISNIFHLNTVLNLFIKSLLEMTMALSYLSSLSIDNTLKIVLSTMIISFSGLSIHMQIISSLDNIKYKYYLKGRLLNMVISGILAYFIIKLF